MSEDRLERALQEMKDEAVDAGTLAAARARVWSSVTNAGNATCAEFRQDYRAYLANEWGDSRRTLLEDHLSRCPGCRARIAEMKGERRIVAMPVRSSSRWMKWGGLAAAAALLLSVVYLGRDTIDALMAPGRPRAGALSPRLEERGGPRRRCRTAPLGRVSRTRHHRRLDGTRRAAGHGCFRPGRTAPPPRWLSRNRRCHRRTGVGPHGPGR